MTPPERELSERVAYLEGRVQGLADELRHQREDYQERLARLSERLLDLSLRQAEHMVTVAEILSRRRTGPPT